MIAKKSQLECPAGSHPSQFQHHHPKGQSMGSKQPETNILVFPLFHLLTTACSTSIRLHYNWSERVCACMLEGPSLSYAFQVFKMGGKSPRNQVGHAKFLNFDLCRFRKSVKAKETQTERALNLSHPNSEGLPCFLGTQNLPMSWIFQPVT